MEDSWKTVVGKIKRGVSVTANTVSDKEHEPEKIEKISQPCWFYNTGGCKNKDGTEKKEEDCRYLHILSPSITRPQHINPSRPCDKFNLEGFCKFGDYCKYSHRNLSSEEWELYYNDVPYSLKISNQKRQYLELKLNEMDSKINILEYKIKSMDENYEQKMKLLYSMIERMK